MIRFQALALSVVLFSSGLAAAEREVVRTDWSGFQTQVSARALNGRQARITLTGGQRIYTAVLRIADTGIVLRATSETRKWDTGQHEASIPKSQIASVRFSGRTGKGRLIGTLAGFGGGAAIGASIAVSSDVSEGPGIILIPAIGAAVALAGGLVGYLIGNAADRPRPEFLFSPLSGPCIGLINSSNKLGQRRPV